MGLSRPGLHKDANRDTVAWILLASFAGRADPSFSAGHVESEYHLLFNCQEAQRRRNDNRNGSKNRKLWFPLPNAE